MPQHQPIVVKEVIHNINFTYNARTHNSGGFRAFGHAFDPTPSYNNPQSVNYWKAQLAFRGFSSAGHNVNHVRTRLRNAGVNEMDKEVAEGAERLKEAFRKRRRVRLMLRNIREEVEMERLSGSQRQLEHEGREESDREERAQMLEEEEDEEEEEEEDLTVDDVCFLIADSDQILHRDKIFLLLIAQIEPGNYTNYDTIAEAYWNRYVDRAKITGRNVGPALKRNTELAAFLPTHRLVRKNGMGYGPDWGPHVTDSLRNAELLEAEGCKFDPSGMLRSAIKRGGKMTEMEFSMNRNLLEIDMPAMMLADYTAGLFKPHLVRPSSPRQRTRREAISQAREKWERLKADLEQRAVAGIRTSREWKLLARHHTKEFLRILFFDENGFDKSGPPVLLKDLGPAERAWIHQEAEDLGLYTNTCRNCNDMMVIGSGKNRLGQQKYAKICHQPEWKNVSRFNWAYTPRIHHEEELW